MNPNTNTRTRFDPPIFCHSRTPKLNIAMSPELATFEVTLREEHMVFVWLVAFSLYIAVIVFPVFCCRWSIRLVYVAALVASFGPIGAILYTYQATWPMWIAALVPGATIATLLGILMINAITNLVTLYKHQKMY